MKVLMVVSWYSEQDAPILNAGVFHYEHATAMQAHCETALFFPYDTKLHCAFSKDMERGILTYRSRSKPGERFKGSWIFDTLREVALLQKVCMDFQPDLIHAHCGLPAGRAAVLFGKIFGYPVIVTEHSPLEHMNLSSRSVKAQMQFVYRNSAANVCVSKDAMERLQPHFPDCSFRVIYNGIFTPEVNAFDGNVYAHPGKINCSIVAAFYDREVKGYQHLLPAIRQLKEQGLPIVLHICGGGEHLAHYQAMARELEITDCCIFYGQCSREKVYSVVSQMDFSISASLFESAGIAAEEAMLLGKPLVVTRSGGTNSLVTEDTAIVVDRGSTDALVDGIRRMVDALPEFDSETIRQYAYSNFEIHNVSRQYDALYRRIYQKS